jgi:predicted ribosome quality control (RQC) complex YloA/Tae2 family protein
VHNNYYYIRQVSAQLKNKLIGWKLVTCFSQEKDELVLGFCTDTEEFYIKAVLKPDFACLVFPSDFQRARKNSINLLADLINLPILDVIQFRNERSFAMTFENGFMLLFKMHGNRSNLVLFKDKQVEEVFNNKLISDQNLNPDTLHRDLDQSFAAFGRNDYQVASLYPTFGKSVLAYLKSLSFEQATPVDKWTLLQQVVHTLENPSFYITVLQGLPALSLLPLGEIQSQTDDAFQAANLFYSQYAKLNSIDKEKRDALRLLEKRKGQTESYIAKTFDKLASFESQTRNEHLGHIIMAHLHEIPPFSESVELHDFYHDRPIRIKLKKELNAQKNAEVYYRKAKNEKIEIEKLEEALEKKEKELAGITTQINTIQAFQSLKELRKYLKEIGLSTEKSAPDPSSLFKRYEYMGFEILVGKNAKNNDLLTQQYAYKEDLWLHARDVTGSHVIIKYQAGKNFPEPVIEKAAGLAAWYSKLKNDTVCPVIVTPKKFVRKTRDLPEGAVIVEKEKVVLVEPKAF